MTESKKPDITAQPEKSKAPIIAVVAVVALIAIGSVVALSGNGVAKSDKEETLSEIAPASADATDTAEATESPMIKLGDPIVAVVNGTDIKRSDVLAFIGGLPEQVRQMPIQTLFPLALEQVINNKVISEKATSAELLSDPEVEKLATQAKEQIVRNVFVDRQIESQITQKKLLDAYGKLLDSLEEVQETKARHILVDSEEKARALVVKLDEGANFEELAKTESTGPEAQQNAGELGWFAKSEMVPEFAEAAFALEPGTYTKEPVKTQFGWHIIKAEERRKRPEPEFEAIKPQLEAQLRQQVLTDLVSGWQKEAQIKKYDINGEEVKEGGSSKKN